MGLVKVEVPFEGEFCSDCIFEAGFGFKQSGMYCDLFETSKVGGKRCKECFEAEID